MLTREEILAIVERIGTENAPSLAELQTVQPEIARLLHSEAKAGKDLTVLTTLRKALTDVGTAITDAETQAAAIQGQIDELLDGIADPDASAIPEPDPDPTDGEPPASDEPPGDADGQAQLPAPAPEALPVAAAAAPSATTPPVRTLPLRDAISRVSNRPAAPAPQQATVNDAIKPDKIFVLGEEVTAAPSLRQVANAFERVTRSPSTGKATLVRFDALLDDERILPGTTEGNTRVLDEHVSQEAVAAAGGCCSLPTPIRSQNVLSSAARPLRASLPNLGVQDTGAVTYFPAVCLPDEGAALWLCADDELVDPDDDTTWKDCVFIDCPTAQTTIVDAVYRCLTIGEFQRRFATEQWMAIIQATLALQARVADARLWARMLATVNTTHDVAGAGSFFVTWAQGLQLAADSIREDQRYIEGAQLHSWVPHWFRGAIFSDLVARRVVDIDNPAMVDTLINSVLANANVNLTTLGPDTQFIEAVPQANGALQDYPNSMSSVVAVEGHYSFLDGGQFDLGIEIRDLDLARQNAVAAFAESFEGLLARGCNAKRLNFEVDICREAAGCAGTS